MKSNVPWSVKGIDPEARVVAKEAARKAGMTLGEWMSSMIRETESEEPADNPGTEINNQKLTGVSSDQLRAVVDSLNRLNERLKSTEENLKRTEEKSREAMGGLNQGLETVFERIKRMEKARTEVRAAVDVASATMVSPESRERIASLKSLEHALSLMIDQFETSHTTTIQRVANNEAAVGQLNQRVNVLDTRITAGFQDVHDALDAVGNQLDHTERTATAVMVEAQNASQSNDEEFVERTSKKLQLLGNEIKRSGDQIAIVEGMVSSLTQKIEAAERRSAEGIADVASELNLLREDIRPALATGDGPDPALSAAAAAAEETVASLQKSYEDMITRIESPAVAAQPVVAKTNEPSPPTPEISAPLAYTPEATHTSDIPDTDVAPTPTLSPQDSMRAAMNVLQSSSDPRLGEPVPNLAGDNNFNDDAEFDEVFADKPSTLTETIEKTSKPLTAREKILAAAKARKERAERERAADDAANAPSSDVQRVIDEQKTAVNDRYTVSADTGQNKKLGLPLIVLLGLCVVAVAVGVFLFFRGGTEAPVVSAPETTTAAPTNTAVAAPSTAPAPDAVAVALDKTPDGRALYEEAKTLLSSGLPSDQTSGFSIMREAAIYGHVPAQSRLGELYFTGSGTDQNLREAKRWFENAAISGNAIAMHRLGSLAIGPEIDAPKYDVALDWFARAANYGVVDSMYNLGYLYDPAADVLPVDMRDAGLSYRHYMLAARQGDEQAKIDGATVAARLSPAVLDAIDAEVAQWSPLPVDPLVNDGLAVVN